MTTAMVIDGGIFQPLAHVLAKHFERVLYCREWRHSFPRPEDLVIGSDYNDIEKVDSIMGAIPETDLFIFPDSYFAEEQAYLRSIGKSVFGGGWGERLELDREYFDEVLKEVGLPTIPSEAVKGMKQLRERLQEVEDKYIKVSFVRGLMETWHHSDYKLSKPKLDEIEYSLGCLSEEQDFIIQDSLEAKREVGSDQIVVDGKFPDVVQLAVEGKDKTSLSKMLNYSQLPKECRTVNEAIAPILAETNYRGFFSTEVRVGNDNKPYLIDPACFSSDTEVLCQSGWKYFYDLDATDELATLNPISREIEYQKPINYTAYPYKGDLIRISNRRRDIDLLVTPNHSVWGSFKHPYAELKEYRADNLPWALYIPRTGIWSGIHQSHWTLPAYSLAWKSGRHLSNDRIFRKESVTIPMKFWLRFLAIYLSEGHCRDWSVQITQHKYNDKIRQIISDSGFKWTENKHTFTIHSTQLSNYLKTFGKASEKYVPDFVKTLSPELIDEFLTAYTLGDGSIRQSGSRVIFTCSSRMANDLQELFLKAGSVCSIFRQKVKGTALICPSSGKTYIRNHDIFVISERSKFRSFYLEGQSMSRSSERYLSTVDYDGMVYDVEVPNHILFVRRNGKPCWSGNCRLASPCGETFILMCDNLGEVIEAAAEGEMVNPAFTKKYAAQAIITADMAETHSVPIYIDPQIRDYVCLYHSAVRESDGQECVIKTDSKLLEIGSVIGLGNSIDEAIKHCRENAKKIECYKMAIAVDQLDEFKSDLSSKAA